MDWFHMIFHILVIFGPTIQLIEAGLLNPVGNMNSVGLFRPLLTTFRGSVNTGYIPNNSLLPLRGANAGITYFNPVSRMPLGNGGNTLFYATRPTITQGVLTQNPYFQGPSPSPVFNVPTDTPISQNTPDYDAILADRFPDAVKLLEQLKKLNKIKEEQRNKAVTGKIYEQNQTTTQVPDNNDNNHIFRPHLKPHGHVTTTGPSMVNGRLVLKKLKKKKFYFQAKPVRPENEKPENKDVVYFVDT